MGITDSSIGAGARGGQGWGCLKAIGVFAPAQHPADHDYVVGIVNDVDDAPVSDADSVGVFPQLDDSARPGIACKGTDTIIDATQIAASERIQFALCPRR